MKSTLFTTVATVLLSLLIGHQKSVAQTNIVVQEQPEVSQLMDHYLRLNKQVTQITGWRITILTTTDRRQIDETKINFQKQFNLRTKWEYKEPYYHLKAGAYISRNEANYALENIKKKFPGAFLSIDKIPYEEF